MKFSSVYKSMTNMLTAALAAAGLLASCVQMDEKQDAAVGYLAFPELEVDVTVEGLMETRAVSLPDVPSATDFDIVVTDVNGKTYDLEPGTELPLPVGSYTISASYGSNSFGTAYFAGSASGTIEPVTVTAPSLSVSLKNSLVRVTVGPDLEEHFTAEGQVRLTSGGGSVDVEYGTWTYVPSGEDLLITMAGKNSASVASEMSYTISSPAAKTAYDFTAGIVSSLPTISLGAQQDGVIANRLFVNPSTASGFSSANLGTLVYEASTSADFSSEVKSSTKLEGLYHVITGLTSGTTYYVRARIGKIVSPETVTIEAKENYPASPLVLKHDYDDETNYLTGSSATLDLGLTSILKEYVKRGYLIVSSTLAKGNTLMRTSSSDSGLMSVSTGWPYLPQGSDYTLSVSYKAKGESEASVYTKNLLMGEPSFSVTLGQSYTSYDKYAGTNGIAKDATNKGNDKNNETIYDISSTYTIISDLMSNSNYNPSSAILLDGNPIESGNKTGLTDWRSYVLKATVTFDGKTVESASKTHVITGLPYSYDFQKNKNVPSNWTSSNIEWYEHWIYSTVAKLVICLNGSNGYLVSPKFSYNGSAEAIVEGQYYRAGAAKSANMYVGASSNNSPATSYITHTIASNTGNGEKRSTYSSDLNMSSSTPYVSIYHNNPNPTLTDYLCVYSFSLQYK